MNVSIKDEIGFRTVRPCQDWVAVRADKEGAADALTPSPRSRRKPANVAGTGNPKPEVTGHRSVIVTP